MSTPQKPQSINESPALPEILAAVQLIAVLTLASWAVDAFAAFCDTLHRF